MTLNSDISYPIHALIEKRWSPRSFSEKDISQEDLRSLLEAARWAPSCFNEQPWAFIIARKSDVKDFQTMLSCLVEANRIWAQGAPVLAIAIAKTQFSRNGNPNRHALHDVGLAVGQMGIQAMSLGIYMHQMAGIHAETIRQSYQLPPECEPVTAIAFGYPGPPHQLPEALAAREQAPRQRHTQDQFVFTSKWQNPL